MNQEIVVIAHNIRSSHNIGSIFRTCDGFGVNKLYLTGYTPYPVKKNDPRLPHIAKKVDSQINKTALGAEKTVQWEYCENPDTVIDNLEKNDFQIIALEQNRKSAKINKYKPALKTAVILGEEVKGVSDSLLKRCGQIIEIPMFGKKESFNVSVSTAIALYHLKMADFMV